LKAHPEELISAYLDGELHGAELQGLLRHLGECGQCSSELEQVQSVRAAVRSLPVLEVPGGLVPELDAEVIPLRQRRGLLVGAAAAAVAVVITLASLLSGGQPTISVEDLNSRFAARISLDPAFGPAKVIAPDVAVIKE
jgi:anti-sigma factor RsiW